MTRKDVKNLNSNAVLEKEALNFAETLADPKGSMRNQSVSIQSVTVGTVANLLQSPEANYARIAAYMDALRRKNGVIGRLFGYLQSHLTYNYTIYGTLNEKSGYEMKGFNIQEYIEAANFIDRYQIKFYAPYFVQQVLINGMAFFYKQQDSKGISYVEFPIEWCRIYAIQNGVYRFEVDMSKVKDDSAQFLPKELQSAYEQFKQGNTEDVKKWTDKKFFHVGNKGVAFCLDQNVLKNGGVAISEFAALITDSLQVEQAKENIEIKDRIDTIRILHSKIPTDKDGKPTMSSKVAKIYDGALKRALPDGIAGVTSPMDLENIPLNGSGNTKSYDTVGKAQSQLFMTTGTPSNLFGSDTTSSNIVKLSVQKDAAWLFAKVLPMLERYYDDEFRGMKTDSNMIWKTKFIRQSYFTLNEDIKMSKESVTMGGSRLDYLASTGMEPVEIYNKLVMEQQMLDIDSIMLPKQTSFTMSSKDGEAGRPKTENPTDDTDRIQDAQ